MVLAARPADRPGAAARARQDPPGQGDLLGRGGQVARRGVLAAAVAEPGLLGELQAAEWDARCSEREGGRWSGRPNGRLRAEVASLPPGRALDVGCGEGADAIWPATTISPMSTAST
jgi:hypothetical protein